MIADRRCPICDKVSTFATNFPGPFERFMAKCESCGAEIEVNRLYEYNTALNMQKHPRDSEMDRAIDMLHKFYAEALGKNTHNPMTDALFQTWQAYRKADKANGRQKKNRARHDPDQ